VGSCLKASRSNIKKQATDCLCTEDRAKRKANVWWIIITMNKGRTGLLLSLWNNKLSCRHLTSTWQLSPCLSFTTHSYTITTGLSARWNPIYQGLRKVHCCWYHDRPMDAMFGQRLYVFCSPMILCFVLLHLSPKMCFAVGDPWWTW